MSVGRDILARIDLPAGATAREECTYTLDFGDGRWTVEGGPNMVVLDGRLDRMPIVTGLFSALDLRSEPPLSIDVTTAVHASRTTTLQALAWALAVLCIAAALLLVAVERRPRPAAVAVRLVRAGLSSKHPVDAVVGIVLVGWLVISPAFPDDGWSLARQSMFSASGGFSNYYNAFAANLPNGYWLEWVQHWLSQSTSALLLLRLPSLACLAVLWVLCRWILSRVFAESGRNDGFALWALAAGFLVGSLAWGMTLRQEPVTALLVTGILACSIRFLEREATGPLVLAALLVPLAITGHHAAVVSISPVLVLAPRLFAWGRPRLAVVTTILVAAIALLVVLASLGADFEQRRDDALLIEGYAATASTLSEIERYANLSEPWYGTPLRRTSVALMALAALGFVLRRRRTKQPVLDLPGAALSVGLLLLIATPEKWPWHFGTMLGIAGVAVAAETLRLRDDGAHSHGWQARPALVVGAATLAAAWAWGSRQPWNNLDLQTLGWAPEFENRIAMGQLMVLLPLALFVGWCLFTIAVGRGSSLWRVPWNLASVMAPMLVIPVIAFTAVVLVADTVKTSTWTLGRQNVESLLGSAGCGLPDDVLVPVTGSMQAVSSVQELRSTPDWVASSPVKGLPRFALGPLDRDAAGTPWFELPAAEQIGFFVAGNPGPSDRLELEWGHRSGTEFEGLGTKTISAGFPPEVQSKLPWRFVSAGELPARLPGADRARVILRSESSPGAAIAVTAPVRYETQELAQELNQSGSPALVYPRFLMYFPCVRLPRLSDGVVEVPGHIAVQSDAPTPVRYTSSPFLGVLDLYGLERLPMADSQDPPDGMSVFRVDGRIPGAAEVPPTKETFAS